MPSAIFASSHVSANTSSTATQNTGKSTISDHAITPQKSRDAFDDIFNKKDPVSRFVLDPGYGHLKIFAKNRGDSIITFSLVHTDSRKQYIVKTIGPHKKFLWESVDSFSQGLRSGNYEIQWRAGGDIVHVSAYGVTSTTTTGNHVVTPQKARDVFNDIFNRKDPVSRFELDRGYGHLKIYVKNNGNSRVRFSLVHKDSGKLYITKDVGPHRDLTWDSLNSFSQGLRSGDYEIQWRANGDIVNIETWGVSGQNPSDVQ